MRRTFATMGTVASLHLDAAVDDATLRQVEQIFARHEATFSLYRDDTPAAALARGEMTLEQAPAIVRDEYARAVEWRTATSGWFTPHRPDGVIDLSGTIKAVALHEAAAALDAVGAEGLLGVGGDIVRLGHRAQVVGVIDPDDRSRLLADTMLDRRRAVATSGSSERGDHIWSALGRTDIRQATVLADDIVTADVLATAVVAAGSAGADDLLARFDVDALLVTDAGLRATPGWPRAAAAQRRG
jgi:thiamine biosynthesis lipoprotein